MWGQVCNLSNPSKLLTCSHIFSPRFKATRGCCRTDGQSVPDGLENRPTVDSLTVTHFVAQFTHVPNLHGLIPASREQPLAVGAERHAADQADVAAEGADQVVLVVGIP